MNGAARGIVFSLDPIARFTQVQELHPFCFKDSFPLATPPAVDYKWLLVSVKLQHKQTW